jgi:predicted nucleic acid-binding protein
MIIVVDTNIVFSALLSHRSAFHEILQNKQHRFVAPNFIFVELFKYKEKISKHSKLESGELLELLDSLIARVRFIPIDFISSENLRKGLELCSQVDLKDSVFVALTIELNALLWTGDNKLKTGLIAKGFNQFFNTKDIQ